MKFVYRLIGRGGGEWTALLLKQTGLKVTTYERRYEGLSGPKEATKLFTSGVNLNIQISNDADSTFYTGQKMSDLRPYISDKILESSNLYAEYHPDSLPTKDELWAISEYVWEDSRYNNIKLDSKPKPPYTIYTDASLWPDKVSKSCSVGFVISGVNGNSFIMGSPVKTSERDNNAAEYYAVQSALEFIPDNSEVKIKTDSKNVTNITDKDTSDPRFSEVKNLDKRISDFSSVSIEYVDREYTEFPDKLAETSKWSPVIVGKCPRPI